MQVAVANAPWTGLLPIRSPAATSSLITLSFQELRNTAVAQRFIHVFSWLLVILLGATEGTQAVEYTLTNTALANVFGLRLNDEMGTDYPRETLDSATQFIWGIFQQQKNAPDRKDVQKVSLIVEDTDGVAFTSHDEIHLSAIYVGNYSGDVRREVSGVLYHEMTHVWQWNGNGRANEGLIEGIADYVRLKPAGYAPSHWVKPGQRRKVGSRL